MRNYKGRRVTTPEPLGKKSRPTIFYNSEDLPDDWVPEFKYKITQNSNSWQLDMLM